MSQPSALYSLYDDRINTPEEANIAESKLCQEPGDIETRAQVIHYYFNLDWKSESKNICKPRFHHICWFIKNQPDMVFCGTAPFYIRTADPYFETVKELWQQASDSAPFEMRRINACMYIANVDRSEGLDLLNRFFSDSNRIWVTALRDLLSGSKNCFASIVESERSKLPIGSDDSCRKRLLEELEGQDWHIAALCHSSEVTTDDLFETSEFDSSMSLSTAAKLAGCTVFRFQSTSIIGFNPELVALRFRLACWIIRHLPFTVLGRDPIFLGPFEFPRSYDIFEQLNLSSLEILMDFVAEHWINQLLIFPKDNTVAKNAASFAVGAKKPFPNAARVLISELSKTSAGKAALSKADNR